jgi:hypothetical protein
MSGYGVSDKYQVDIAPADALIELAVTPAMTVALGRGDRGMRFGFNGLEGQLLIGLAARQCRQQDG